MRADVPPASDQIDFAVVMRSVGRGLPRLAAWALGAAALTYGTLLLVAPRFESEAEIAITARSGSQLVDPKREGQSVEGVAVRMDKEAVNTHVRALLSRDLAARVAGELKLSEKVEFNSRLGSPDTLSAIMRLAGTGAPRPGESDEDRVLSSYYAALQVYPAKDSRVIGVRFTSSDPQLAADIPNLLVETYRGLLSSRTVAETDEALKVLAPRIDQLTGELAEAERAVEAFRGEANIFRAGQQATGLNEQQLAELTAELSRAQGARSEAEARTRSAREMMKAGSADALPDVQRSPLIQNLVQQRVRVERQVSELSATLLPGHPRMQQLNADLTGLKRQITAEVGKVVDSLDKEAKVALLRVESIKKSLAEIKARIVTASPDELKLRQLENDAKAKREELVRIKAQYEANRLTGESRSPPVEVQIITKSSASSVPVFPKKGAMSMLAMTAVFILGLALLVTRGVLSGARRPASRPEEDGPNARARPSPAVVPERAAALSDAPRTEPAAARVAQAALAEATEPSESARPAITAAAERLTSKSSSAGIRTLITGESEDIGPASEALALAKALSAAGHGVIIVDWSMSGDGLAADLGIPLRPGLTELVEGKARFEDVVQPVPGTTVHAIAAGPPIANAANGLDADRINLVLDALDEAYEQIVVVSHHEEARTLFETIEGRFDTGILVVEPRRRVSVIEDLPGTFLGFEVSDLDIIRLEQMTKPPPSSAVPKDRLARVAGLNRKAG